MTKQLDAGLFISLEGPDGSGKTTQLGLLYERLREEGYDVLATREPGGTPAGEKIRELLLYREETQLAPLTEILLFAADRAEHVARVIRPALTEKKIILCDRSVYSNLAYQGYGLGYDPEMIRSINREATEGLLPDLSFFLDIAPQLGMKRTRLRACGHAAGDRIERRGIPFQERVRLGFRTMAGQDPERIALVEVGEKTVPEVHEEIWSRMLIVFRR
ncbi:MAG: dTMP kinase [Bacillota bacterium]